MYNSRDVKDKNITLENAQYRARVEYYTGRTRDCGLFETMHKAQVELNNFPRDVWDGYDFYHPQYQGLRHEFKRFRKQFKRTTKTKQTLETARASITAEGLKMSENHLTAPIL